MDVVSLWDEEWESGREAENGQPISELVPFRPFSLTVALLKNGTRDYLSKVP